MFCSDWLASVRVHFNPCFNILLLQRVSLTPPSQWPSGRGGWSPHDHKVRGLTPSVCKSFISFYSTFILFIFIPFYFNFDLFFNIFSFIILKICPTWTPFIFVYSIWFYFISGHLVIFWEIYMVLNLMVNEIYFCHDVGLVRVDWTFLVSNQIMDDQMLIHDTLNRG